MDNEYDQPASNEDLPGDGDQRPRARHTRRSSSNKSLWLILGSVGCVALLGCLGLIGLVGYFGIRAFTTDIPAAQAVADRFLNRLQQNKVDDAYDLTSPGFRSRQNPAQFSEFIKSHETFTRQTSRNLNGVRAFQGTDGKKVYIQTTLNAPGNTMTCTVVLIEDGNDWRVDQITLP